LAQPVPKIVQQPGSIPNANHLPFSNSYFRSALVAQKQICRGGDNVGDPSSAVVAQNVPDNGAFADMSRRDAMALAATIENQSPADGDVTV
jgi:hypothetical protein